MKKFLSIILALALIIGLVPSAFADDAATQEYSGITVEYDFTKFEGAADGADVKSAVASYEDSYGFWKFSSTGNSNRTLTLDAAAEDQNAQEENVLFAYCPVGKTINDDNKDSYFAYAIDVPKTGKYDITLKNMQNGEKGAEAQLFVFSVSESFTHKTLKEEWAETKTHCQGGTFLYCTEDLNKGKYGSASENLGSKCFEKGEYIVVFAAINKKGVNDASAAALMTPIKLILDGTQGDNENYVPMISSLTSATDEETGVTTVTATATKNGLSSSKSIEVAVTAPPAAEPEKDVEISSAFSPESTLANGYSEPEVIAISKEGVTGITSKPNGDGTFTVTAPETNDAGKKFLYWAKGLSAQKKILLYKTNELTDYLPDAKYANYLIPVYEGDITTDEYYNANGQLIPGAKQDTIVSMPGYGNSTGWDKYGDNIYVAHYDLAKPEENITITKTGTGTYTLNKTGKYAYGDVVICTANGEGTFKCWKKNNEIVGTETTYKFKAWEDCVIEAVYEVHVPYTGEKMRIIIDEFTAGNETGVMAEFIGLDNAVEKGIMFVDSEEKETRIAMTTKDNQFSVIADKNGTYKGYAILKNHTGYTLITDGAIKISNKAE